jgi:hypothetical protein
MVMIQYFQVLHQQVVVAEELIITLVETLVERVALAVVVEHLKITLVETQLEQVTLLPFHLRKVIQVEQFL